MYRIVVCVKAVPDPEQSDKIRIDPVTKTLIRADIPLVINPLDRYALEAALQIKAQSDAFIHVVSMGPPPAGDVVKECLALGGDEGTLLTDPALAGADVFATSNTLAKYIDKIGPVDIIFCGMASSDGATEWVGPELATLLGFPVVSFVSEFQETQGDTWQVKADIEDGYRLLEVKLPVVFTVTRDVNTPKTLSFSGIIKSRQKEIKTWGLTELDVSPDSVGLQGSPTIVSNLAPVEIKRTCEIITGTAEEKADILVSKLIQKGVL
jgi:electron transfer flavoprotein beta subunit